MKRSKYSVLYDVTTVKYHYMRNDGDMCTYFHYFTGGVISGDLTCCT